MKTIKSLLLVLAITFSSIISATTKTDSSTTTESSTDVESAMTLNAVKKEVARHLKRPNFKLAEEVLVFVKFTLNDANEMVVLSNDSEDWEIDRYIKKRLNYVKLEAASNTTERTFIMPVRIQASN